METSNNSSGTKSAYYWMKIDRFFAWLLLLCMIIFFITGYGMTKGIIDAKFATNLHNNILPIVILISFVIHASYATRLAMIRWQAWNIFTKAIWFLVFGGILIGFIYIDQFYQYKANNASSKTIASSSPTASAIVSASPSPVSTEKIFTVEELAKYDGSNGNPAYVAVSGVVYDMSNVFINGEHFTHGAGTDLTQEFLSRHTIDEINKYPVVGKLK